MYISYYASLIDLHLITVGPREMYLYCGHADSFWNNNFRMAVKHWWIISSYTMLLTLHCCEFRWTVSNMLVTPVTFIICIISDIFYLISGFKNVCWYYSRFFFIFLTQLHERYQYRGRQYNWKAIYLIESGFCDFRILRITQISIWY